MACVFVYVVVCFLFCFVVERGPITEDTVSPCYRKVRWLAPKIGKTVQENKYVTLVYPAPNRLISKVHLIYVSCLTSLSWEFLCFVCI